MPTPSAPPVPQPVTANDPARQAILRTALVPLDEVFGDRVQLDVDHLVRIERWVFLKGTMRTTDDRDALYAGTEYEDAAASGFKSNRYVALLKHIAQTFEDNGPRSWRIVEHRIGPTDVCYDNWPDLYGAPRELFGF